MRAQSQRYKIAVCTLVRAICAGAMACHEMPPLVKRASQQLQGYDNLQCRMGTIDLFHIGIDVLSLAISFMIVPSVYCKQVEKHVSRAEHVTK